MREQNLQADYSVIHLCMVRLELMRLNTAPALDPSILADVSPLTTRS